MNADLYTRLDICLHNDELETLKSILILAHAALNQSPAIQLRGIPLCSQAGLVGPELFRVKAMLEELGKKVGACLPYDVEPMNFPIVPVGDGQKDAAEGFGRQFAETFRHAGMLKS